MNRFLPLLLLLLISCQKSPNAIAQNQCFAEKVELAEFTICAFELSKFNAALYLNDEQGENYGDFNRLKDDLKAKDKQLLFAMNGGMYDENYVPIGLYIENSQIKKKLHKKASIGNFGLKPNGVFYIENGKAGVLETHEYALKFTNQKPIFATQSGPMLVINGKIHPKFEKGSSNFNIRNGVGISADGQKIYFAISDNQVNFYDFATLFKDKLQTPNALYLDGSISKIFSKELGRNDKGDKMGVIIGIMPK